MKNFINFIEKLKQVKLTYQLNVHKIVFEKKLIIKNWLSGSAYRNEVNLDLKFSFSEFNLFSRRNYNIFNLFSSR